MIDHNELLYNNNNNSFIHWFVHSFFPYYMNPTIDITIFYKQEVQEDLYRSTGMYTCDL